ncbi:MAG: DUF7594 domain-containing protein [Promethearchaeati archaeon]
MQVKAELRVHLNDRVADSDDLAIGMYYSSNSTWNETDITWNNQPDFAASPTTVLDTSFEIQEWYSFDVTNDVMTSLNGDKMLSQVLKQVDETLTNKTFKYFTEREHDYFNASYLAIEYEEPVTTNLAVDGESSSPHIDYIKSDDPTLSWDVEDTIGDFQRGYEVEMWNSSSFNETMHLLRHSPKSILNVHDTGSTGNLRPFGTDSGMRFQFKYNATELSGPGVIDRLCFDVDSDAERPVFENLEILLTHTNVSGALGSDFQANLGGARPTTVLFRDIYSPENHDGWLVFDVENSFFLNKRYDLIIEFRFTNNTGDLLASKHSSDLEGSVAYTWGVGAEKSTDADYAFAREHNLRIDLSSQSVFEGLDSTQNSYPFDVELGTRGIFQIKYNKSLLPNPGTIDRMYFPVNQFFGDVVYENFTLRILETPIEGELDHTDFEINYGGIQPTVLIDKSLYRIRNIGGVLAFDFENAFQITGDFDLLIEMTWDSLKEGGLTVRRQLNAGVYRAYNLTFTGSNYAGNDTRGYDLHLDVVYSQESLVYDGCYVLENATNYFWRVRTMDSTGIWAPWESQQFKYEVLTSVPEYSNLNFSPSPLVAGQSVTVSIEVTYFLSVNAVWFEFGGTNHSMTGVGDSYSYTWTPASNGTFPYTIYMESYINTWSSTQSTIDIVRAPDWTDLVFTPEPGVVGQELTVSITVQHDDGIDGVWFEFDGINYTMTSSGDVYSYTWTPASNGTFPYTIYMNSSIGTWNSTSGNIVIDPAPDATTTDTTTTETDDTTPPIGATIDTNLGLLIAIVVGVVVVALIIIVRRRE